MQASSIISSIIAGIFLCIIPTLAPAQSWKAGDYNPEQVQVKRGGSSHKTPSYDASQTATPAYDASAAKAKSYDKTNTYNPDTYESEADKKKRLDEEKKKKRVYPLHPTAK